MSAELKRITSTESWRQWEGRVVNDFPLSRLLGCSDHGAVFLTEYKARNLADAAIKLVRADTPQAQLQLEHWQAAAALDHPHLVRLLEMGRCTAGEHECFFVVMEYAEQTLAQILRRRALGADEIRELLPATLDALTFLHRRQLVHGQLKPSNFLAVNDQLKLASDTLRPMGHTAASIVMKSPCDPPESKDSGASAAGDVWGLGMTLLEALTQRTTVWAVQRHEPVSLPPTVPAPFVGLVRRCLSLDPADRPTIAELAAPYKTASRASTALETQPPTNQQSRAASSDQGSARRTIENSPRVANQSSTDVSIQASTDILTRDSSRASNDESAPDSTPGYPIPNLLAAAVVISLAAWLALRWLDTSSNGSASSAVSIPTPPAAPAAIAKPEPSNSTPADIVVHSRSSPPAPPANASAAVLHEVTPDVKQSIRDKIQGRVHVTVRVLVDPDGNVFGALMENPGPSKYFARLAEEAAREWQFTPADSQSSRVWLLRFEFSRNGVTARATEQ